MKNNRRPGGLSATGLGPAPGSGRRPLLSRSRAALLETLQAQAEPTRLDALVAATGLHPNTVREHVDGLVRQGLVLRHAAQPTGRGRPAWLYAAVGDAPGSSSEYAGLASALAATIHRTSSSPTDDADAAGLDWGRDLARQRGAEPAHTATAARREVVTLMDELGFAPEADARAASVRLTRCPLLEAARRYPDVVCGVHLGLVRSALTEYGGDPEAAELRPFAEPGACRLRLAGRRSS